MGDSKSVAPFRTSDFAPALQEHSAALVRLPGVRSWGNRDNGGLAKGKDTGKEAIYLEGKKIPEQRRCIPVSRP